MSEKDYDRLAERFRGKNIDVVGFGVSHRPLAALLCDWGAKVTVYDKKPVSQLEGAAELEGKVRFITGEDNLDRLCGDIIFKTPGMRRDIPQLVDAVSRGAELTSEMQVFFDICPCKLIAITGSEGKTTTSTLIYNFLIKQGFTVHLGGNIGTPLLPRITEIKHDDFAVAELSSFQLSDMTASAPTAVITNIVEEHLNWHRSMDEYINAKKNVFLYQNSSGRLVLNADYETTRSLAPKAKGDVLFFSIKTPIDRGAYLDADGYLVYRDENGSVKLFHRDRIRLVGDHNVENFLAAICATHGLVDISTYRAVAAEFAGVEHRMEFVREKDGVKYYNDSIATSPTSVIACLKAQKQRIISISGGSDKKLNYADVAPYIVKTVKHLILMGETAQKIYYAVTSCADYDPEKTVIEFADDMEDAVKKAHNCAKSGDIVYLSPISASFDHYANFEQRGKHYKETVNKL